MILHFPNWFILLPIHDLRTVFGVTRCGLGLLFIKGLTGIQFVPSIESSLTLTLEPLHLTTGIASLSVSTSTIV